MKVIRSGFLALAFALILTAPSMAQSTYVIDATHSTIGFSIKHLTVSTVLGNFKAFEGTITLDAKNPAGSSFEATIQTKSINTENEQRDEHLRNADFFDAQANPIITFKTTSVTVAENTYTVTGDLTIKGVTKSITLPLTVDGPITSPMGGDDVIGVAGQTKINRQDFGVKWNKAMDKGGLVLGDEVIITVNLEAHAKQEGLAM